MKDIDICVLSFLCSYGDKTPKTALARVYASVWMIVGLMLMSVITAQVSSSITADGLRPLDDLLGDRVCEDIFILYWITVNAE